jgi:hypothetical protein
MKNVCIKVWKLNQKQLITHRRTVIRFAPRFLVCAGYFKEDKIGFFGFLPHVHLTWLIEHHDGIWRHRIEEPRAIIARIPVAGVPAAAVPVAAVPVAGVPVAAVPVAGVPVAGVPVAGVPVAGVKVAGVKVAGVTVAAVPFAGVPVAGVPAAGVPAAGVTVAAVPVAGVKVAGVPFAGVKVAGVPFAGVKVAGVTLPGESRLDLSDEPNPACRFLFNYARIGRLHQPVKVAFKDATSIFVPHVPVSGYVIASLTLFNVINFRCPFARLASFWQVWCPVKGTAMTAFVVRTNDFVVRNSISHNHSSSFCSFTIPRNAKLLSTVLTDVDRILLCFHWFSFGCHH